MTQQLDTSLSSCTVKPLHLLEETFATKRDEIEEWFLNAWGKAKPPFYGSVDLRNAGFKVAPIDMNLFPAGFNNLNPNHFPISKEAAQHAIERVGGGNVKRILIVPESHTRNIFYWENVNTLKLILESAGFDISLGFLDEAVTAPFDIALSNGPLRIFPLLRKENQLYTEEFEPDFILLNNDLSEGIPAILQNLSVPLMPPAELGWSERLKSNHFQYYAQVANSFAETFSIDPWWIAPLFRHCGQVDFMQREGMDCLIDNAEKLFIDLREKYKEYDILHDPFLIVKADSGTYGMAVMTVRHIDELRNLNRKERTRMSTIKGGQTVNRVIIQEGVYTFETIGDEKAVAEPVVYLFGERAVGGFYRIHNNRGVDENLNAPGMQFKPMAFSYACNEPCRFKEPTSCENRYYAYGVIARLSMLAASYEMRDLP